MTRVPSRTSRDRAVLVGRSVELDRLAAMLPTPPVMVATVFEAIGEVSTAPLASSFGTIFVDASVVERAGSSAVSALRQVDPTLQIHAVTHPEQRLNPRDEILFDAVHTGAPDAEQLTAIIGAAVAANPRTAAPPQTSRSAADSSSGGRDREPVRDETPETGREIAPDADRVDPAYRGPAAATDASAAGAGSGDSATGGEPGMNPPADAPGPEHSSSPGGPTHPSDIGNGPSDDFDLDSDPLGDIDLVEQLLDDPAELADVALQLIRQQTGWSDLELRETEPETGAAVATVAFEGQAYGALVSSETDEATLSSWADWLSRWMALARTHADFKRLSLVDHLTGAWNRRFFQTFLEDAINSGHASRRPVTVMVFDIDDFKRYNDEYGHEAGDVILRETVALLQSVIRKGDKVCRIGGDEFAVIFADPGAPREPGSSHPESVEIIARRFQDQIATMKFPKLGVDAPGSLTISGGLATFPWDGLTADDLLRLADQRSLMSKRRGKNAITFGQG